MTSLRRRLLGGPLPAPRLISLPGAYRERFAPILRHVRDRALAHPSRTVAVLLVDVVERRWYDRLQNGQRALLLRELTLDRGVPDAVVVSAPWDLPGEEYTGRPPPEARATDKVA